MRLIEFINKIPKDQMPMIRKYSERRTKFFGVHLQDITHVSYRGIKLTIPDLLERGKLDEVIQLVFRYKRKRLYLWRVRRLDNFEKLKFLFWIEDQYMLINQLEQRYWTSPPDPKMVAAGIKELDPLGHTNLIDSLANGDVLKWDEVWDLPYWKIFDKQRKAVIDRKIAKNLNKQK